MKRIAASVVVLLWAASTARADLPPPPPPPPPLDDVHVAVVAIAAVVGFVYAGVWVARRSRDSAAVEQRN